MSEIEEDFEVELTKKKSEELGLLDKDERCKIYQEYLSDVRFHVVDKTQDKDRNFDSLCDNLEMNYGDTFKKDLNDKEMNIQKLISDELNEMVVKREGETE
jgi:hypothetical protein